MKIMIGLSFIFGFCTKQVIDIISQRSGTVGGEILLIPMMIGIALVMYHVGRDCS